MATKTKKITGSRAICEALIAEGVETVFGYPGGAIMPLYDALYDYQKEIRHILVRHEQGAAHAAEGYARACGKVGVAIATSGPGATNLVTGIADAMLDSVPIVCITGQVPKAVLGTDAFQETDVIGITMPITKWNYQVTEAEEIPEILAKAFYIAANGRPGPVLVDITKNAQFDELDFCYEKKTELASVDIQREPETADLEKAAELINEAKKPLMFVGHGVLISQAEKALAKFVEKTDIPVASTLLGLSCFPTDHENYAGMLGMHGNYGPNLLTNQADLILAVGMRFDDRVTGNLEVYAKQAKIIHVDIDPAEINKNVTVDVSLICEAKSALEKLLPLVEKANHQEWFGSFRDCAKEEQAKVIDGDLKPKTAGKISMGQTIDLLSKKTDGKAIVVPDVGQHQMMSARYYRFKEPNSFISSGGLGTMGFSLPAAFGAKVGAPEREVLAIIGDGSFQMTLQELATIRQENIAVKTIILNNNYLGMVRQWQEMFFDKRYSFVNMDNPDFVKISEGFAIPAARVSEESELEAAVDKMLSTEGPYLLEVVVEKEENVFPMVPSGESVSNIRLE